MADLTEEQKSELVSMLACFREPAAIIAHFQSEHQLELDHKQVGRYDPTRSYYAGGEKWREIFEACRKAFVEDVSAVPISNLAYRLRLLQEGTEVARRANNWTVVASLLEQAAKEVGGMYTSKRTLQISDNARLSPRGMSPEERRAALTEVIRRAMEEARNRVSSASSIN